MYGLDQVEACVFNVHNSFFSCHFDPALCHTTILTLCRAWTGSTVISPPSSLLSWSVCEGLYGPSRFYLPILTDTSDLTVLDPNPGYIQTHLSGGVS